MSIPFPLFFIPNIIDYHNQTLEGNMDFGNNALSSRKEDKSRRVSYFYAFITVVNAALEGRTTVGEAHMEKKVFWAGMENTYSLDSLFREENLKNKEGGNKYYKKRRLRLKP